MRPAYFFSAGGLAGAAAGCGTLPEDGALGASAGFCSAGGADALGAVPAFEPRRSIGGGLDGAVDAGG